MWGCEWDLCSLKLLGWSSGKGWVWKNRRGKNPFKFILSSIFTVKWFFFFFSEEVKQLQHHSSMAFQDRPRIIRTVEFGIAAVNFTSCLSASKKKKNKFLCKQRNNSDGEDFTFPGNIWLRNFMQFHSGRHKDRGANLSECSVQREFLHLQGNKMGK